MEPTTPTPTAAPPDEPALEALAVDILNALDRLHCLDCGAHHPPFADGGCLRGGRGCLRGGRGGEGGRA